jgi:hypothetical protein
MFITYQDFEDYIEVILKTRSDIKDNVKSAIVVSLGKIFDSKIRDFPMNHDGTTNAGYAVSSMNFVGIRLPKIPLEIDYGVSQVYTFQLEIDDEETNISFAQEKYLNIQVHLDNKTTYIYPISHPMVEE